MGGVLLGFFFFLSFFKGSEILQYICMLMENVNLASLSIQGREARRAGGMLLEK